MRSRAVGLKTGLGVELVSRLGADGIGGVQVLWEQVLWEDGGLVFGRGWRDGGEGRRNGVVVCISGGV